MKRILYIIALILVQFSTAQSSSAFQEGEWFKFKMSYSGFLKAGNATLLVKEETLNKKDYVINKEETTVYAKGFGDSSIDLLVWFWIKYPGETGFMEARHDAVVAIHRALKDADILIPFPIRTLDFDAKGGTKLDTMLSSGQSETHSDNDANIRSSANSNSSAEASNADADR